jgi:hypothetical protein
MVSPMETQSFTIPEYRCSGYGLLFGVRFGLLVTALSAASYLLTKEISRKGLTSLGEAVMVSPWLRTHTSTQIPSPSSTCS